MSNNSPDLYISPDGNAITILGDPRSELNLVILRFRRNPDARSALTHCVDIDLLPRQRFWDRLRLAWAMLWKQPTISRLPLNKSSVEQFSVWLGAEPGWSADPLNIHRRAQEIINELGTRT